MTTWRLIIREILHRKVNFGLGLLSVAVAVGSLVGALTLLKVHDVRTRQILDRKEADLQARMTVLNDEMRKAMLKLGFNIVILPKDQNLGDWYTEDYASKYMPEEYVTRLAQSGIITVRHFLPSLQQKIKWPETRRTIILVGTRGEVPNLHKNPTKPLVQPVPPETVVLGYELHQSLGLQVGDKVKLLGREFTVHKCHAERGSKDDITVWINLQEAQELLDKKGVINAILALQCACPGADLANLRMEISRILPNTQVIERASKALARAEARKKVRKEAKVAMAREKQNRARLRNEREQLASILVPLVMLACAVWIGFLALGNVRERRSEIGILCALGLRSGQIFSIFLFRAIIMGTLGGALGLVTGFLVGKRFGITIAYSGLNGSEAMGLFDPVLVVAALILAPLLSVLASWIPAMMAARQDPAEILQSDE